MAPAPPRDPFLVVAIDGGGVRGVLPAMLLQDLHRNAGLRVERIDLLAGTSAGSLTAIGLAAGLSIDRITSVFQNEEDCRRIFTPNDRADLTRGRGIVRWLIRLVERLGRGRQKGLLGDLNHLLNPRYTASGFEGLVRSLVEPTPLRDLRQRVFAPTLCLDAAKGGQATWRPTAFHNLGGRSDEDGFGGHHDATVIDAVVASSSAPVYFPPYPHQGKLFVDGGMIATNPSALALSAAIGAGLIGPRGIPLDRVRLLSLGTGVGVTVFPPADDVFPPPFGALGWMWPAARGAKQDTPALPLAQALEDSSTLAADYQARMILPAHAYRRVQLALGESHIAMDDSTAVPRLERLARDFMAGAEWARVRDWVRAEFTG